MEIDYKIKKIGENSVLSGDQLKQILKKIPLDAVIAKGHKLSLEKRIPKGLSLTTTLLVEHDYLNIVIKPPKGMRVESARFSTNDPELKYAFRPSGIMFESFGGGACCDFIFNTKKIGLPYDHNLVLSIYKFN